MMKDLKFEECLTLLTESKYPEDVFGDILTEEDLKLVYRKISAKVHPDIWMSDSNNKIVAEELFKKLGEWNEKALVKLKRGKYGDKKSIDDVVITTKKNIYTINQRLFDGDICQIYGGFDKNKTGVYVKIVKDAANNDLLINETETLNFLWNDALTKNLDVMAHIRPLHLDSFEFQQGKCRKRAIIFSPMKECFSLEEIIKEYPNGLDIKDAAWMWNRLLGALMVPSQCGVVHGSVIPSNFLVYPDPTNEKLTHNGVLIDWAFSVKSGECISVISSSYKDFYPKEVLNKTPVDKSTDVYMAAMCLIKLLNGDVKTKTLPTSVPMPVVGLIRACLLSQVYRIKDVFELYKDFNDVLKSLYGDRKFRKFSMPKLK